MRIDISEDQKKRINELIEKYNQNTSNETISEEKKVTPEQEEEIKRIIDELTKEGRLHETQEIQSYQQKPNQKITTTKQKERIDKIIENLIEEGRLHEINNKSESHQKTR